MRLATAPAEELGLDASAVPATTVWRNGAVDLDLEAGRVTLEDGSIVEADVVIGKRFTQLLSPTSMFTPINTTYSRGRYPLTTSQ